MLTYQDGKYDKKSNVLYVPVREGEFRVNKVINDWVTLELGKELEILGIIVREASKQAIAAIKELKGLAEVVERALRCEVSSCDQRQPSQDITPASAYHKRR